MSGSSSSDHVVTVVYFNIYPASYETEGCDGTPSQQDAATVRSCLEDLNDLGLYTIPQKWRTECS